MDWTAPIDAYCERLDATFWSEPVNAVTNAAFLVAALLAFRDWRARGQGDPAALLLIVIVALVGIGSFLFHTFATRWAALADVLPIALFINIYFCLALRRLVRLSWPFAVFGTLLFLGASQVLGPLFARVARVKRRLPPGTRRDLRRGGGACAPAAFRCRHAGCHRNGVCPVPCLSHGRHARLRGFPARHAFRMALPERAGALLVDSLADPGKDS